MVEDSQIGGTRIFRRKHTSVIRPIGIDGMSIGGIDGAYAHIVKGMRRQARERDRLRVFNRIKGGNRGTFVIVVV